MGKIMLVGMNNPYSVDAKYALYPLPKNSAGARLYGMMRDSLSERVEKLEMSEYADIFERRNLVRGDWNRAQAATNAAIWYRKERVDERSLVLCGGEVKNAFEKAGVKMGETELFKWFRPGPGKLGRWCVIPHPSGRAHAWNDKSVREAAAVFFRKLVADAREAAQGE